MADTMRVCPECGTATDARPARSPLETLVPLVLVGVVAVAVVLGSVFSSTLLRMRPWWSDTWLAVPATSYQDLQQIAKGMRRDPPFSPSILAVAPDAWRPLAPSPATLVVSLGPDKGVRVWTRSVGWPARWIERELAEPFDETHSAALRRPTARSWRHVGARVLLGPHHEPDGTYWRATIYLPAIALTCLILLAAWYGTWLLVHRIIPQRGWQRAAAALVVVLSFATMALTGRSGGTEQRQEDPATAVVHQLRRLPRSSLSDVDTGLTVDVLREMDPHSADAAIARAAVVKLTGANERLRFTFAPHAKSITRDVHRFGWPWTWARQTRLQEVAPLRAAIPWRGVRFADGRLEMTSLEPGLQVTTTIMVGRIAMLLLLLWSLWIGARVVCLVGRTLVIRRRRRRNRCASCGYPLPAG